MVSTARRYVERLLLAVVMVGLLCDVVYADTYSCAKKTLGNAVIDKSIVTTTAGCIFYANRNKNYVKLNIDSMSNDARSNSLSELNVTMTETNFDNAGLQFQGVKLNELSYAYPLIFVMTNSNITHKINNNFLSALQFSDYLPLGSSITIKDSVFTSRKAPTVLMPSLILNATVILLENNELNTNLTIWGMNQKNNNIIFDNSSWIWKNNRLNSANSNEKANIEIWTQSNCDLDLTGGSAIIWEENTIMANAFMYSRPWFQYMSTTTLTGKSNITWTQNNFNSTAGPSADSYPYIWYSHSDILTEGSAIIFEENDMNTYAPFYGRIWYQRVTLTVTDNSRVAFINNNMTLSMQAEAISGDLSIWYQGSIFKSTNTVTDVSNNGNIVWDTNRIAMNGGNEAYLWRQRSVAVCSTSVSEGGHITWSNNTIDATVYNGRIFGWSTDSTFTTDIGSRGTVAFNDNKMNLHSGSNKNCFFCWEGKKYTVAHGTLSVENNTIYMDSNKNESRLTFVNGQGNIKTVFDDALLRIDGNNITTSDNLQLAMLWDFITDRLTVDEQTRVLMCYNKASYGRIAMYKPLVAPTTLAARLVVSYCPFTYTKTLPTTTTMPATTTNSSDGLRQRGEEEAADDDSKSLCVWCIIVPILLALLLCCLLLLLFFCCCRKKKEHKVLDDVEEARVVNVDHEANEHFTNIEKTQVINTHRVVVEHYEDVQEATQAPAAVNPLVMP